MSQFEEDRRLSPLTQWIVSLAVSIVGCASLFVVLAFFLTDQHITLSTVALRMDLLQQRQDRLATELDSLRHTVRGDAPASANTAATAAAPAVAAPQAPAAEPGVEVDKQPAGAAPEAPPAVSVPAVVAPQK